MWKLLLKRKLYLHKPSDKKWRVYLPGAQMIVQIFIAESLVVITRLYRSNTRSQHWQKMRRVIQQKIEFDPNGENIYLAFFIRNKK